MRSLFQKPKEYIEDSSVFKGRMGKRIFTIFIIVLITASILVAIPSFIILVLARVSEQPPRVFHASVQENTTTPINLETTECPKVSYFYSNPAQQILFLRVHPDSRAVAGITLSFYSDMISDVYYGRFALCYALPGYSCEIRIPINTGFYVLVGADSDVTEEVAAILFRWECYYKTNIPLITSSVFFSVSIVVLILSTICWSFYSHIIKLIVESENKLHNWLRRISEERKLGKVMKTPQQYTFEEILSSSPKYS